MMRVLRSALSVLCLAGAASAALAADEITLPTQSWSFDGPFGTFDRAAAQRGAEIYLQVCSNCHSLKQAYYRNLRDIGLSEEQVRVIASGFKIPIIGEDGQPAERPALPSDHFHAPFPNDKAARAALNGALPPDLSVIIKAREGGPDYIYGLLTGYGDPPPDVKMSDGMYYNKYFPGHQIAMPPPLQDDAVTYTDGVKPTLNQEAHDVVTFLTFIANPELESRHRLGVKMVLFLVVLTGLTYAVKRKVWAGLH